MNQVPAGKSRPSAIEVFELTKRFGELTAVDRATFTIDQGEIFGLIGPNGAGKSTLIKMLTTLLPPTSGRAVVAGQDIIRQPAQVRRRIGYVPQLLSADGSLTGRENLLVSARLYAIPRSERPSRIAEALGMMGLTEAADHLVQRYSGGMIRRLEIAQSMLHRPPVLFMDEPTVGLDPIARQTVWTHIRQLKAASDTTMLVTTHYMEEADELCDRIALIADGRIVAIDTPAGLKAAVGPGATLDDVFAHLVGADIELERGYGETRLSRRAAREHG
ncbi:MAG: ATP-binding cassette domain-containing protein [Alphaproteobacteria bacterium]